MLTPRALELSRCSIIRPAYEANVTMRQRPAFQRAILPGTAEDHAKNTL